jgi:Concanavalin A-like lectin/glucanases superfamily/Secretion system C-terminal sorting domain
MKKFYTTVLVFCFGLFLTAQTTFMHYPMDGNADDISTNNFDGTVNGPTLTTNRYAQANRAYAFDGVNDHIALGMINSMNDILTDFTVSFWMKSSNVGVSAYSEVFGNINTPGAGLSFNIDIHRTVFTSLSVNSILFYMRDNSSQVFAITVTEADLFDDNWHCVVFKINSVSTGNAEVYIDGALHAHNVDFNQSPNLTLTDFEFPFAIGALNNRGTLQAFYKGSLDQFRIYDYAIGTSTILSDCSTNLTGDENFEIIQGVQIYPNPASQLLHISNQNENITKMTVYDMHGKTMLQSAIMDIDISEYSSGVYLIVFEDENQTIKKQYKFVKE